MDNYKFYQDHIINQIHSKLPQGQADAFKTRADTSLASLDRGQCLKLMHTTIVSRLNRILDHLPNINPVQNAIRSAIEYVRQYHKSPGDNYRMSNPVKQSAWQLINDTKSLCSEEDDVFRYAVEATDYSLREGAMDASIGSLHGGINVFGDSIHAWQTEAECMMNALMMIASSTHK